ncbi:MAG: hypothetical protein ABIK28_08390 [Planctomycetota bacterium]
MENTLLKRGIRYERAEFGHHIILSGLDPSQLHRGTGLPLVFRKADWEPIPDVPDGFN